ncbi:MAG TPA: LemA family protein [Phenylobacterium sp.]|uniref:LemA family protein n=1 Tax=Phenylobacterium sp. TaxID=1871053 RepID=UPI002C84FA94|nr:LemA family protein [Phenylobacterium sp.]HSV03041.1 LemA family protein [Phenylobacterium sp.]
MTILIVIVVIVVVLGLMAIGTYNRLVALRQNTNEAFADIDVQLKQRLDLVPNLVETVKGYAGHERGTLDEVTQARAAAASAGTVDSKIAAENALSASLGRLMAVAEAYPDLKANANFMNLQSQLSDIENKLAAARRYFNNAVREFNASIQAFPAVLFAAAMGFQPREFFDLGADRAAAASAPQVKF